MITQNVWNNELNLPQKKELKQDNQNALHSAHIYDIHEHEQRNSKFKD